MQRREAKKKWNGDKARPHNRAKTWGTKDRDPKRDRRSWKRELTH